MNPQPYDVIIIGGSYAGMSVAMALGRSLRRTLVIDGGDPCNKQAPASHNFVTQDGRSPAAIMADVRSQVLAYDRVELVQDQVTAADGENYAFTVTTERGTTYHAKKLLFATGLHDGLPDLPGLQECWGISAIHCPYCHGYEIRGLPTGLLMNTDHTPFMIKLIRNLTEELTVFSNGPATFDAAEVRAQGVTVIETPIDKLEHTAGQVSAVCLQDGSAIPLRALYLHPQLSQKCPLPEAMGCALDEHGFLTIDEHNMTTVEGVYAAGDCTTMMRSVASAVAAGNRTGALVNHGLVVD